MTTDRVGKIIAASEDELFQVYLARGMDDIMSFPDYLRAIKNSGCEVTHDG